MIFWKSKRGDNIFSQKEIKGIEGEGLILKHETLELDNIVYNLVGVIHIPRPSSTKMIEIIKNSDIIFLEDRYSLRDVFVKSVFSNPMSPMIVGKAYDKQLTIYYPKTSPKDCKRCGCDKISKEELEMKNARNFALVSLLGIDAAGLIYKNGILIYGIDTKMGKVYLLGNEKQDMGVPYLVYNLEEIVNLISYTTIERMKLAICKGINKYMNSPVDIVKLYEEYLPHIISVLTSRIQLPDNIIARTQKEYIEYYGRELYMAYYIKTVSNIIKRNAKKDNLKVTIITGAAHTIPLAHILSEFNYRELVKLKREIDEISRTSIFNPYTAIIEDKGMYYKVVYKPTLDSNIVIDY